jgi:hypothetical protein
MKLRFNGFLVLLVVLMAQNYLCARRTVSGVVSDNAGLPLPGVSVVKELNLGHKLILMENFLSLQHQAKFWCLATME